MSLSFKNWPYPEQDELRAALGKFYQALKKDADEGALAVRGVDNRWSARSLIVQAAFRTAEYYSYLRALVSGIAMPSEPARMAICTLLLPSEVEELAGFHDLIATDAEADGDEDLALKRRERAEQLRAMVQP